MTQSDDIHLLIQALVDGELDAATALDTEMRIAADPALTREYESMVAVKKAIGALPRPEVSEMLAARIAALAGPSPMARPAAAATRPPLHDFFMTRYTEAYANEIAAFIAAIEKGSKISPSGADGLAALALADAAVQSVKEGKLIKIG